MLNFIRTELSAVALLCALVPGQALACDSYDAVVAAVQAQDRPEVERLHAIMQDDPACDAEIRDWAAVYLARERFRDATDESLSAATRREYLEESLGLETHWRTLAALGELEWSGQNYGAAARWLERALTEIAEGNPDHEASQEEIVQVRRMYTDAVALSDELVASAEGESELFRTQYRGFEVEETPLPITFVFDSTEFDEQGQFYADALLEHLLTYNPPHVELDGHTDPQGTEEYNLELSLARAAAVQRFLQDGGYTGEVVVRGLGEAAVPEPPTGVAEGSEEHYRIARRVTFRAG